MPSEIKRKKTFGRVSVDHFSPELILQAASVAARQN
jgi:hypothetical protein